MASATGAEQGGPEEEQGTGGQASEGSEANGTPPPGTAVAAGIAAEGETPVHGIPEGETPVHDIPEVETPVHAITENETPVPGTAVGETPEPGDAPDYGPILESTLPPEIDATPDPDATPEPLSTVDPLPEKEAMAVIGDAKDDQPEEWLSSPHASTSVLEEDEEQELQEEDAAPYEEEQEEAAPHKEEEVHIELMESYRALVLERDKIQQQNGQLQYKLHEYFRRKKGEEVARREPPLELEKQVSDHEQRYRCYMLTLDELRQQHAQDSDQYHTQVEELCGHCQELVNQVDEEWRLYQLQKREVALSVMAGKKGKQAAAKELDELQAKEQLKEAALIQVRLENIKLKNRINRYELTLRVKEELAEGLHLIDFEQLKIENQTYNEKIEERNEELLKLRKKITGTVQVLTHLKEKLQSVQAENQMKKERLREIEDLVAQKRDVLTKTKQARDSLRSGNVKLRQKCGLLGNEVLLRDFEDNVDATEELCQRLETLRRRHAELTLNCSGIKKKIDEAKCSQ